MNRTPHSAQTRHYSAQAGIGLIEVLIAILILAIGLLGMASMQTNGMQMTTGSLARSQAVVLANDIIDRARANRFNRDDYAIATGSVPTCATNYAPNAALSLAQNDINEWLNSLACLLPSADGIVTVGNDNVVVVTVTWESRNDIDGDGSITVRSQL